MLYATRRSPCARASGQGAAGTGPTIEANGKTQRLDPLLVGAQAQGAGIIRHHP